MNLENADKGFYYSVTPEELEMHQQRTIEERLDWVEQTARFIRSVQTRDEKIAALEIKWDKNIHYYHKYGFPEWL